MERLTRAAPAGRAPSDGVALAPRMLGPPSADLQRAVPSAPFSILLIVGISAVTFFAGLGSIALWEPDEPRFAEATRQMLLRGDFLTPWFNGQPRFEKPILFYWLQLPFFAVLGPSEWAARAPSALSGFIAVLATFGLARDLVSRRAGVLAAVCLATTFRFVLYARQGLTDVPVVAAVTCALWAMSRALRGPGGGSARAALLAWACAGAGVLLKGPVGLLAPLIWSASAVLTGGRSALARTRPFAGVAIVAAIAVPWYAAMWFLHGRAFVQLALGYEVVARYLSPDFPGPNRGVLYYWGVWLGDALPWSLFLIPALWWAFRNRGTLRAGEADAMRLAAIWFVVVLVVFSASQYKLPHYILPAYPAMALAIGIFMDATLEGRVSGALWRLPAYVSAALLAAGALLTWLLITRVFEPSARDPAFVLPVLMLAGAIAVAMLASPVGGMRPLVTLGTLALALTVCYGLLAVAIAPRQLQRFQPAPALAAAARSMVADSEPLAVAGGYRGPGLVFYARHQVRELRDRTALVRFLSEKGRRHCVLPLRDLDEVRPLVNRPLRVRAEARVFSVRMKRLLERDPGQTIRTMVLVTAE